MMKTLTLFYLEDCPYCRNARRALKELGEENPSYEKIAIDWIEESHQPQIAEQYDYYYVPAVFFGKDKLYEARPSESYLACKDKLREVLDSALAAE